MKPLVSVIIPAYNIEKYIASCLDSVLAQTLREIEIVIVNDGSTDKTGEICEKYAGKDKRIKLINRHNAGLPSARNEGLVIACADYVTHIDGDDWVSADFCEKTYSLSISVDADIVFSDHLRDDGTGKTYRNKNTNWPIGMSHSPEDYLLEMALTRASHSSWNKLIKRSLYVDNKIIYPPEIVMAEDMATTYRLAMVAKKIAKCEGAYYHYRIRPGSLMETSNYSGRDGYAPIEVIRSFCLECSAREKFLTLVDFHFYYRQFRWQLRCADRSESHSPRFGVYQDFIANIVSFKRSPFFCRIPLLHKFLIYCYSFSPSFGCWINNLWLFVDAYKRKMIKLV